MGNSKLVILLPVICLAAISSIIPPPPVEAAVSCNVVLTAVSPCLAYLRYGGAAPPPACCNGAKSLYNKAPTTPDRQTVCRCLKDLAPRVGAKAAFVNSVIEKCHVNIPYRFSPSLDCSKIR